jgi:tRNA(fMet)-specific endonuclease VapC
VIPKVALDTNAYRALDDGNEKMANIVRTTVNIGIPIIVLGELYHGIFAGTRQQENLFKLTRFLRAPRLEILDIDQMTAKAFGEIAAELRRIGRPIQQNDIWIAALSKQYGYTLATNDSGFSQVVGLETVQF